MRHLIITMLMAVVATTASAVDRGVVDKREPLPKNLKAKELKIKRGEPIDSMSYAMGANMGLSTSLAHIGNGIDLDTDAVRYTLLETYASQSVDEKEYEENNMELSTFHYGRVYPYMEAKQRGAEVLPEIYNEVYTREGISKRIGYAMGCTLVKAHIDIDIAWVMRGFDDGLCLTAESEIDEKMLLNNNELRTQFIQIQRIEQEAAKAELEQENAERARNMKSWLATVEQYVADVVKCESGLLYRIDRVGTGDYPIYDTDKVTVHYVGKQCDGTVFDSSYERGEPITFSLHQVIKGWTEGLKYINEGGKITLWIPAELAYGERGAGQDIGPYEALKFEIELLEVKE